MLRLSAAIVAGVFTAGACSALAAAFHSASSPSRVLAAEAAGSPIGAIVPGNHRRGIPSGADMSLELYAEPASAEAGEPVVFVAQIANAGPEIATLVGYSLELPLALEYVGIEPATSLGTRGGDDWNCALKGSEVQCMLAGELPVTSSAPELRIQTVVAEGAPLGPVEVVARVSSFEGDNYPENNTATLEVQITGIVDPVFAGRFECSPGFPDCPRKAGIFTTREEFLANVPPGYYEENFAELEEGTPPGSLSFSGAGITYEVQASRPWNPATKEGGLYNLPGTVSTNSASDSIVITVTSGTLMAIGGNFWSSDIHMWPMETDVVITLSDGTVETFYSTSHTDFRGFVAEMPITRIEIDAVDDPVPFWPAMENLIVSP